MFYKYYLLLCIFSILTFFVDVTVAREAIVGGETAEVNQFPYQVSIFASGVGNICGGGIIGDYLILTAAHCVVNDDGKFDDDRISVVAGTNDRRKKNKPAKIVLVKKIFVPTMYKPEVDKNDADIAVLKLNESLGLLGSKNLKALELPNKKEVTYAGKTATIAGFGWNWVKVHTDDAESGGHNDTQLRFAAADVLTTKACQLGYQRYKISRRFICARVKQHNDSNPHGVCEGDSGSPLVHENTVIGILSMNPIGCAENIKAGVYTRVSHYLTFIENVIQNKKSTKIRTIILRKY